MAFLELRDLHKRFGATVAVDRCTLAVERGAFVSLLGPSGCGKTTTLRMIAGFEPPTSGTIHLDGADISPLPVNRRNIGVVFQSYALFPNMTVGQNIAFGMRLKRMARGAIRLRVRELLALIDLAAMEGRYPHQLSGGQQQRVALARALAIEPRVLLLDEPLSALDARIRVSLRNEIRAIQRELGITTIYVTHDQEEALSLSDEVVVMNRGRVEQIGTPLAVYNTPATPFVAAFVGTLNLLSATVVDPATGRVTVDSQPLAGIHAVRECRSGETVTLALRPEAISLDTAGAENSLRATVDDVIFLGGLVRVRVRLGADIANLDLLNRPGIALPARGEAVTLAFPGTACLLLDDTMHERDLISV